MGVFEISAVAFCPAIPNPGNGTSSCANHTTSGETGSEQCTFACNPGFALSTSTFYRTCQIDGTWNAAPPTCSRKRSISLAVLLCVSVGWLCVVSVGWLYAVSVCAHSQYTVQHKSTGRGQEKWVCDQTQEKRREATTMQT